VAVDLTGFDYDLKINDRSFLKGEQDRELTIAARDKSAIQIPVTLNYQDLYETFSSLRLQDSTPYQLAGGVSFDLPVLGKSRIPLSTSGEIPAVKLPAFSIDGLKVHTLSLSKAEMELNMSIENSNAFDLFLKSVEYELAIDGKTWAKGLGAQETRIARKGRSSLSIPISLDVGQIVFGISQALSGKKALQYDFRGNFTLGSSLPLLKDATVPLDRSGILNIQR
jgi:LEA14-like dessication related protein